jgi:hypothetical protein
VQNVTDVVSERDHRLLRYTASGNLCRACSQPTRTATVHHDRRSRELGDDLLWLILILGYSCIIQMVRKTQL